MVWKKTLLDIILSRFEVDEIIVFGSWARGTQTKGSDIDLVVIMETQDNFVERGLVLTRVLWDFPYDVDFVVYTPEEWAHMNTKFSREIRSQGQVLYKKTQD